MRGKMASAFEFGDCDACASTIRQVKPRRAHSFARNNPTGPAPTTRTSTSVFISSSFHCFIAQPHPGPIPQGALSRRCHFSIHPRGSARTSAGAGCGRGSTFLASRLTGWIKSPARAIPIGSAYAHAFKRRRRLPVPIHDEMDRAGVTARGDRVRSSPAPWSHRVSASFSSHSISRTTRSKPSGPRSTLTSCATSVRCLLQQLQAPRDRRLAGAPGEVSGGSGPARSAFRLDRYVTVAIRSDADIPGAALTPGTRPDSRRDYPDCREECILRVIFSSGSPLASRSGLTRHPGSNGGNRRRAGGCATTPQASEE